MSGLLASPIGFLIGGLMGAFGGGGSLIAIPVLVYLVGQDVRAAQATALVIVMIAALAGLGSHLRSGEVRWRMGLVFGLTAGASALGGSLISRGLDPDVLLLAFSPVMLAGAWAMASERARQPSDFRPWRHGVEPGEVARVIAIGAAAGAIVGVFGVGGGFVIVPALVLALHLSMTEAVGTSLLAVVIASAFALGDRLATGDVEWAVALPFSAAALIGSLAGRRLATGVADRRLQRWFALVIAVAAVYTGLRSGLAL